MSGAAQECHCIGACGCGFGGIGRELVLPGHEISFRHSAIRERMLDQVGRITVSGRRPLRGLGTHSPGDPALALMDAAAGVAHVLARTLGRLYADGTLLASSDRTALAMLTGLLGHVPRPAISAATDLVVIVDELTDPAAVVTVPKGTKIASIPGKDEMPITFETEAEVKAHAAWNSLLPLREPGPQTIEESTELVLVEGAGFPARTGDAVLIRTTTGGASSEWLLARVLKATAEPTAEPPLTRLTLSGQKLLPKGAVFTDAADAGMVFLLGARAQAFGAGAANMTLLSPDLHEPYGAELYKGAWEWKDLKMDKDGASGGWQVHLDAVYADAAVDRAVLLDSSAVPNAPHLARIAAVRETSRSDFGLSAKCTLIQIDELDLDKTGYNDQVRTSLIHLETARASLVVGKKDVTVPADSTPDRITLQGEVLMAPGRRVMLIGPAATGGACLAEAATVRSAMVSGNSTTLILDAALNGRWQASGLTVRGNVARASQGETTPTSGVETLGAGDPARALPRFALAAGPVAHVAAPGPRGYAPALEVRVGGRLYTAAERLWGEGEDSVAYRVGTRADGKAEVQFAGRLPSGAGNVTARYRKGGGAIGNLAAGRLSMILTPVPGIARVTNPLAAEGGSDAESADEMRQKAPAAVRTLDRAVSLMDFEAFAAGYRGVGKALATELSQGMRRVVCLTIATTSLTPPSATLIDELTDAIDAAAPPGVSLRVTGYTEWAAVVVIALASDPARLRTEVEAAVRKALVSAFGPAVRSFGVALHCSQVLAAVQAVPGVVAAMVTSLTASEKKPGGTSVVADSTGRLDCPGPSFDGDSLNPAGLLSLADADVSFTEMDL